MNVTISVFGRFHAFNLARQLYRREHLARLITSYPVSEVERYGVPRKQITGLPHFEVLKRGWRRLSRWSLPTDKGEALLSRGFEWSAARHIPEETDIFVGWSGTAEKGLQRAKKLEAVAVLERGSGHIQHQRDLLREEAERYGLDINVPHSQAIQKEKREYEQAEVIVVPSQFARHSFCTYGVDESKLVCIPYGVDVNEFHREEKKDETFRIVYAGRMSLQKGVHYLLKAFAELGLPDAELWLIGRKQPEIEPFFEEYKQNFEHIGHKPQDELYKYYSQGSVFVLNSVHDGFGMVIPQAMACGLPAICTMHTGGPDIVRDGTDGFIIPPRSVNKLKEKILWCYKNRKACRKMGKNAESRVRRSFRWSHYGDRVVERYSQVVRS